MADIIYRRAANGMHAELIINGVDVTQEVYAHPKLVEVTEGMGDCPEAGLQVTFAVSRLHFDGRMDVPLGEHFPEVAERVNGFDQRIHNKGPEVE